MTSVTISGLSRLYGFFEKYGRERLDGLDKSYFSDLTDSERAEAWAYLKKDFFLSIDCICGLYLLDRIKAVALFKQSCLSTPRIRRSEVRWRSIVCCY